MTFNCKVCGGESITEISGYGGLPRVTSDCKPWPSGGRLTICTSCGTVQKIADERWSAEATEIYGHYEIYHQSAGVEQGVFDPATGISNRRSLRLAKFLDETFSLPAEGNILDVGCGSGVTLAAFSEVKNKWSLYGYDLDARRLSELRKLANFRALYSGALADIPDTYSLVSLIHAAEHLPDPLSALRELLPRLGEQGRLLIQVPNYCVNPFDLVVADHLMHFSLDTLVRLVEAAGYEIETASEQVIVKELSLVAKAHQPNVRKTYPTTNFEPATRRRLVEAQLAWLQSVIIEAERVATLGPLGIFGTSIAAAWIYGALGDKISFFVDEDPSRIGGRFMGRPILPVSKTVANAQIFIPLAPVVAQNIKHRYRDSPVAFHPPPAAPF